MERKKKKIEEGQVRGKGRRKGWEERIRDMGRVRWR